jgi:hypothetical protein
VSAYLGLNKNTRVVCDPTYPSVDMGTFIKTDWKSMYGDVKEIIPSYAPVSCQKEVYLRLFVDYDHAGDHFTSSSSTRFVIYLIMPPILWFSKRQPSVESIVFGPKCVAMKNGIETYRGLRYKLRMMSVALSGLTYVYRESKYVVHKTHMP